MTEQILLALPGILAGPASSVVILALCLYGIWKLLQTMIIPMIGNALERHLTALDKIVETNSQDHQRMVNALDRIETRLLRDTPPASFAPQPSAPAQNESLREGF
jgi:hypothetical protein